VLRRSVESTQYLSIRYTERLAEAAVVPSVGSTGIRTITRWPRPASAVQDGGSTCVGPGKGVADVEFATLE